MNAAILASQLVPLLLVCGIGPGLLLVGYFRFSPLEKLCMAMGASFIAIYLASFALFCFDAPAGAYWATSGVLAVMGLAGWRQAVILFRRRGSRVAMICFAIVLGWDFLHLAMSRHLGGGGWAGDWHEHYDRVRFFLHDPQIELNYLYLNTYLLPARPPMMNLIAAFFCKQAGSGFDAFSLVFMYLNAFAFLPCCLLLGRLGTRGTACIPILAVLFMLNPSIMQNVTWTWTKAMTGGYVVLGVCFYLRALGRDDRARMIAAALCFAAAILVHYSAAPFVLAVGTHYLWMLLSGKKKWGDAAAGGAWAAALLATWFGWSIVFYGFGQTFYSNTSVAWTGGESFLQAIRKIAYNAYTSTVPFPLRMPIPVWALNLRNYVFMMSQTTLPLMVGSAAGIIALVLLVKCLFSRKYPFRGDKAFWVVFLAISWLLGIAANPLRDDFGVAHVTLQPLAMMGICFVAANLPRIHPLLFGFAVLGTAADYALGVYLNFVYRSYTYPPPADVEPKVWYDMLAHAGYPDPTMHIDAQQYGLKFLYGYVFWGDWLADLAGFFKAASIIIAAGAILWLVYCRLSLTSQWTIRIRAQSPRTNRRRSKV